MRRPVVTLLLLLQPLHFTFEASRVLSTIAYRGVAAAIELGAHAIVAVLCAAAARAFWNAGPDTRRLTTIAVVLGVLRTIQSLYWSSLPNDTVPGDELYVALAAIVLGAITVALGWRHQALSTKHH